MTRLRLKEFESTVQQSDWELVERPIPGRQCVPRHRCGLGRRQVKWQPGYPLTATQWPVAPEVMHFGIINLYKRYGLPICITENGQFLQRDEFHGRQVHDPDRIDYTHGTCWS
jgi:beta-glucosidase